MTPVETNAENGLRTGENVAVLWSSESALSTAEFRLPPVILESAEEIALRQRMEALALMNFRGFGGMPEKRVLIKDTYQSLSLPLIRLPEAEYVQ